MKFVVSGANGVLGKGVVKYLEDKGYLVNKVDLKGDSCVYELDLCNLKQLEDYVNSKEFDCWINCVGSYTNSFYKDINSNVNISYNLLEVLNRLKSSSRLILIGSSAEYGKSTIEYTNEKSELKPINVYGLVKSMQYQLFDYYSRVRNSNVILLRIFNLLDKNLSETLLIGKVYSQIKEIKENKRKKLSLGYLDSFRDYITPEKVAEHIELLALKGKSGEVYNSGTGRTIKIKSLIMRILKEEGIEYSDFSDIVDYLSSTNKDEVDSICPDMSKLNELNM